MVLLLFISHYHHWSCYSSLWYHADLESIISLTHTHSSTTPNPNPKPTNEFDAHRLKFKSKPSRFKLEANISKSSRKQTHYGWDFGQSLWDSYEIVSVSKRLESGLVLDPQFSCLDEAGKIDKKRKESSNSSRNLLTRASSRRFWEDDIPQWEGCQCSFVFVYLNFHFMFLILFELFWGNSILGIGHV